MRSLLLIVVFATLHAQPTPNTLSPDETAAGWKLLFDGGSTKGWRDSADSWVVRDGCLVSVRDPRILEDLVTVDTFRDFELTLEWKLDAGGNSGIKYRVWQSLFFLHETPGYLNGKIADPATLRPDQRGQTYNIGYEFQIIDDAGHPDASKGPDRRTGALYGLLPPATPSDASMDAWNTARLVVKGGRAEHWVNGKLLLAVDLTAPAVDGVLQVRMERRPQSLALYKAGSMEARPIALQNHADSVVRFRSVKIRRLD